jgi:hypothetical protein
MNKSRQWRAGLAAIDLTGRTEPTVGAGQSPASRFRQRASQRNKPSFLTAVYGITGTSGTGRGAAAASSSCRARGGPGAFIDGAASLSVQSRSISMADPLTTRGATPTLSEVKQEPIALG